VCVKKSPLKFSDIFCKLLGIFSPNFTGLLYVHIYARLQFFIQLPATLTNSCHINRDPSSLHHMLKMSTVGRNERWHFLTFFPNGWEILVHSLRAYYTFLSTLDCKFLFNYLQLWQCYAIFSATTQRAFRPMVDILSIMMVVALIMA